MESDPDPDGQGLPLGFWAGLQEFFNILQNSSEFLPGRNGLPTWPTCWANWVSVPGYNRPLGPQGGPGGRAPFWARGILRNLAEFLRFSRGPAGTLRGDPLPAGWAPESDGIPSNSMGIPGDPLGL